MAARKKKKPICCKDPNFNSLLIYLDKISQKTTNLYLSRGTQYAYIDDQIEIEIVISYFKFLCHQIFTKNASDTWTKSHIDDQIEIENE